MRSSAAWSKAPCKWISWSLSSWWSLLSSGQGSLSDVGQFNEYALEKNHSSKTNAMATLNQTEITLVCEEGKT